MISIFSCLFGLNFMVAILASHCPFVVISSHVEPSGLIKFGHQYLVHAVQALRVDCTTTTQRDCNRCALRSHERQRRSLPNKSDPPSDIHLPSLSTLVTESTLITTATSAHFYNNSNNFFYKMIKDMIDKQVMELKKLWANKRQLAFQVLNLAMIVFSALMIWKGLMFLTKVCCCSLCMCACVYICTCVTFMFVWWSCTGVWLLLYYRSTW